MIKDFFFEKLAVYEVMGKKYCTAGQVTNDNMVHAYCMLET